MLLIGLGHREGQKMAALALQTSIQSCKSSQKQPDKKIQCTGTMTSPRYSFFHSTGKA